MPTVPFSRMSPAVPPGEIRTPTRSAPISSYTGPCEIEITATAADPDGSVARVDFYAGSSLIASDSASPYAVRWSNVPAGTYALTAIARDNNGAAATSSSVPVTVTAAVPLPRLVVFNSSADHDTAVTSYSVEFFAAGADPATMAPVMLVDVGKPSPVAGEIAVDVTGIVQALPAGAYFSTVTANGAGGSSRSAPSETFVK